MHIYLFLIIGFIVLILFVNRKKGLLNISVKDIGFYKVCIMNLDTKKQKKLLKYFAFKKIKINISKHFRYQNSYQKFLIVIQNKYEIGYLIYTHHKSNLRDSLFSNVKFYFKNSVNEIYINRLLSA